MSEGSRRTPRFFLLLAALRDGTITDRQFARLKQMLASNRRLRRLYAEYILLCAELYHHHGTSEMQGSEESAETLHPRSAPVPISCDTQVILREVIEHDKQAASEQAAELARHEAQLRRDEVRRTAEVAFERFKEQERRRQEELAYRKYLAKRRQLVAGAFIAATVIVSAAWLWISKHDLPSNWLRRETPTRTASSAPATPPIVARIVRSDNAAWLQHGLSTVRGTPLTTTPVFLTQGFVEVAFLSGASVVLQAPAMLQPEGTDQLFLTGGGLSVRVAQGVDGFVVRTPTGTVVDYGTEFSVLVNASGETEALVHKGKVGLRSGSDPIRTLASRILTEGQASAVNASGDVVERDFRPNQIVRTMPSEQHFGVPGQRLDLADVVGGGNGFGTGEIGGAISPVTGEPVVLVDSDRRGTHRYVCVPSNPYIDGVFVPDGRCEQIISSAGHVFAGCPVTNNIYYLEITNIGPPSCSHQWLSGAYYGTQVNPCVLMHANLGITFDLAQIASSNPGLRIMRFRSGIGVSESATDRPCNADFWVLVDGQVRYRLMGVRRKGLVEEATVELSDTDRFLTLITTDGGDPDPQPNGGRATDSDWAMFARAYLELAPKVSAIPAEDSQPAENADQQDSIQLRKSLR